MSSPEVSYSFLTPQSFLERSAYVFRNKHAVVYRQQRWTYPEFAARVNQLASALRGWGLRKGDRVAFLCPNIPPLLEAHFGVPLAGGVLVAMNTRLSPDDIRYILNDCGARLLFVDTELSHLVATVRGELETVEAIINIVDEQANAPGEKLPGKRGEVPKAFVTLKPDASVTQKEIINFCHQHLASFKCPRTVEFAELPKTATAKVQKYRLREKEWAGFEKRIH